MDRWEPALRKNKSAFSVLGWGRANCDGPYVVIQPQERRGRIGMSRIVHQAHLRPSWGQLSYTGLSCWRCIPSRAKRDAHPLQRVALDHGPCRAFQGEFHSLPGKAMFLVFEISWAAGQRREDCVIGGGGKVSIPGAAESRDTTEMRAMMMTNIHGFSSFGLTASKNL